MAMARYDSGKRILFSTKIVTKSTCLRFSELVITLTCDTEPLNSSLAYIVIIFSIVELKLYHQAIEAKDLALLYYISTFLV